MSHRVWSDRRSGAVAVVVVAGAAGVLAAQPTPRGPITAADALLWMAGPLLVGLACGVIGGSRLLVVVAPVAGIAAFEARGRAVLADEWFELLQAPAKERIMFERSGHRPSFDESAAFAELMRRVRDETGAR